MPERLKIRDYEISWHWRDESARLLRVDSGIRASTALKAIKKFQRMMSEEYHGVKENMVVISVQAVE